MVLSSTIRNEVLKEMVLLLKQHDKELLEQNLKDINTFVKEDALALYDRLKIDDSKINDMVASLEKLIAQPDPLNKERFAYTHDNGIKISNRTTAFGTVLIIYESRPDVTIEAAGIAFKSGNKILLKGGKEAINSNTFLVSLWHQALKNKGIATDWIQYFDYNREKTQQFLMQPNQKVDLIIPRGGERLIEFVKTHATAPVLVSGRGNNFIYIDLDCDTKQALDIIVNAKTSKVSACNALDKVLIHEALANKEAFVKELIVHLRNHNVSILGDDFARGLDATLLKIDEEATWYEEFLDYKIVIGTVKNTDDAIAKINEYSGGHSACICTTNTERAKYFMDSVDCAAVYHNASTRFTDGFQFGLGGELAISTDKIHQRGPIGLQHLVTNKWYVLGDGQTR